MKSIGQYMFEGKAEVDENAAKGQETGVVGRNNIKKKLVVFAMGSKGKVVGRVQVKIIKINSTKEFGSFIKATILLNTEIKTDSWTDYKPLREAFPNLNHAHSGKKIENFPDLHLVIKRF